MTSQVGGLVSWALAAGLLALVARASAQDTAPPLFTESEQQSIGASVERALDWLAGQQQPDGSFATRPSGQPGITGLSALAFLSAGEAPGPGRRGEALNSAIDFVLSCQRDDGLFSFAEPVGGGLPGFVHNGSGHAAHYNHAIAGVLLGEVYGMCDGRRQQRAHRAIERGLAYLLDKQSLPKRHAQERDGWRYYGRWSESDLSMTSWQIMFLRAAKNAGFDIPDENVERAVACVKTFFDEKEGAFLYRRVDREGFRSRGVVGSGILALSLTNEQQSPLAKRAGDWLLRQSFDNCNDDTVGPFHYGAFYASQAANKLGGKHWSELYPKVVRTLLANQRADGGWEIEENLNGRAFGRCYSSSLAVLTLTIPYQLLPIFQR